MNFKIKNFKDLAQTELRRKALLIAEAGLESIDTFKIISNLVKLEGEVLIIDNKRFNISEFQKIIVATIGKCAGEGAKALEEILGNYITDGIAFCVGEITPSLQKIEVYHGTHPYPSEKNILGVKKLIQKISNLTSKDLVIFLVSGGGSTLLCLPSTGNLEGEYKVFQALTRKGANIFEINILRKHLSLARGGYLAQYAYPAKVVSLIFSDVLGNDLAIISSGPTIKDNTTIDDALKIVAKYHLADIIEENNINFIETPKDDKYFKNVENILAVSNKTALSAMKNKAEELRFETKIMTFELSGEARDVGLEILKDLRNSKPQSALLYGGETTVTLDKKIESRGGRNLEMALACAFQIQNRELILPFASDGRDNGEFAGAIADEITRNSIMPLMEEAKIFFENHDEYPLFEKIGHYLKTGDTGSNVSDLIIALRE